MRAKKESVTTVPAFLQALAAVLQSVDKVLQRLDDVWIQRIIHPPPFAPVCHDSRILEDLEMEGQS
jgi:hypothetical protein